MESKSKNVLVTGATGSIGSVLAERLSQLGWAVRALVRDPVHTGKLPPPLNIELVRGDLSQPDSLRGCMDSCSLVYHCAAKLPGSDWASYRAINVEGTKALLGEAARVGIERFVHLSTIGVYACTQAENITEDFPFPKTRVPYFATKQEADRAACEAAGKIPMVVVRVGDVYGPDQETWTVNLIRSIKQGLLFPPPDRESGTFNPVYISNLIDALLLLGTHPAAQEQVFNVVDGTPMAFSDYIRRLTAMTGRRTFAVPGVVLKAAAFVLMSMDRLRGREAPIKPEGLDYLFHKATISGEKIRSLLGWMPLIGEADAFRATEQWLRREGLLS